MVIFGYGGITFKKSIVEIKANEVAYSVKNFSGKNERAGGDSSQKFDGKRESWQTLRTTSKLITVPFERHSTGVVPIINSMVLPTHKIIIVPQTIITKEWVSDKTKGSNPKDDGFIAESKEGAEFTVGVTMSARIKDSDTYLSIYGTNPNSTLEDVKVYAKDFDGILESIVKPFILDSLGKEFVKYHTMEVQSKKSIVLADVENRVRERFERDGIEIITFGSADRVAWSKGEIQDAIDETAKFLAQKDKEEAEQKVKIVQYETERRRKEEEDKAQAKRKEIEAQTKQTEASYKRLAEEEDNKREFAKAENDKLIALEGAIKETEVANEKAKVIKIEESLLKLEVQRTELEIAKIEAQAKLEEAQRWNGVKEFSNTTIVGASSIVGQNGEVKTLNLVK